MRIAIVGQDTAIRSNTVWFEVLRHLPEAHLLLPLGDTDSAAAELRLRETAPELLARIHLIKSRRLLGETSELWIGLHSTLESIQPELIHVVAEPWAPVARRVRRWQWPFVIHGAENILDSAPIPYRIRRAGMGSVLRSARGAASWGHTGIAAMREAGLPASTPTALCASRLPDPLNFPISPLPVEVTPLRVAYCGRLVEQKGVQTLIQAVSTLPTGTTVLRVLGEGKYRSSLERLATELGTPVEFLGQGSESDVADLLRWSHVVVVPTLVVRRFKEQWGRIAVEAMLSGRAVVASDSGELPLLLGEPEMVFAWADDKALARLLRRLSSDRMFLETKAKAFAVRGEDFYPAIQSAALIDLWRRVMGSTA